MTYTIAWNIEVDVVTPDGLCREHNATLRYKVDDPYAVCLSLNYDDGAYTEWYFDRNDLLNGLYKHVHRPGAIVSFEPVMNERFTPLLMVHLATDEGCFHILVPAAEVAGFIGETIEKVRFGKELAWIDFKGLTNYLLD